MNRLLLMVVLLLLVAFNAFGQDGVTSKKNIPHKESKFLAGFNLAVDITELIQKSARGKVDGIFVGADESYRDNNGTIILNRRFDVEIGEIDGRVDFSLLNSIKVKLLEKLKASGLQYKEAGNFSEGFDFQYSSDCVVGSIHVRGLFGENKHFYVFFIFNESFCKSKAK